MSGVFPLQDNQARAVDPARTVWLSASAGTGPKPGRLQP